MIASIIYNKVKINLKVCLQEYIYANPCVKILFDNTNNKFQGNYILIEYVFLQSENLYLLVLTFLRSERTVELGGA